MIQDKKINCKIILLGEANVGKTSLINRYVKNEFLDTSPSLGASFSSKTITMKDGQIYCLNIWDSAGSEKYRSVNKFFYRYTSVVILIYDITNKDSFEALKSYWAEEIKNNFEEEISNII